MRYLGDFDPAAVIYGKFSTFQPSTGTAFLLGGTPALSVYKDGSTTESTAGVTLTPNFDNVAGLSHFAIDTGADGTFYAAGGFFHVVITTGTVDGVSVVGAVVGSFTLRKTSALKPATAGRTLVVDAAGLADANVVKLGPTGAGSEQTAGDLIPTIAGIGTSGGAAINQDAATSNVAGGISGVTSATTLVGSQTSGTFASTSVLDGVYHQITGTSTALDVVYQFLIGGSTTPVNLVWTGFLNSANDVVTIQAWNHVAGAWETIGSITGQNGTANVVKNIVLYARHAGTTSAELGKVYIRFTCTGMTNPALNTDQVYVSYSITSRSVGYANGEVWIDTVNGTAGTVSFTHGTADKPVLTIADAFTLGTNLGIRAFHLVNGSSITLAASAATKFFDGDEWNIDLGGQNIASARFEGAVVTGTSTGASASFRDCHMAGVTIAACDWNDSDFEDGAILTMQATGIYDIHHCLAEGPNGAIIDFGAIGACTLNMGDWDGPVELRNMAAGDVVNIQGRGKLTVAASCAAGTINMRGEFELVNNGAATITRTAAYNSTDIPTVTAIRTEMDSNSTKLANLDATVSSRLAGASYTPPPSASSNAVAVVDQALAGHTTAGTVGAALSAASSAGDPWAAALPGAYGAGTAGEILGTNLDAKVSTRSSHSAADIWAVGTRTLTGFGTLVADVATAVWGAVTRTLTAFAFTPSVTVSDKTGFSLTAGEHTNIAADTQTGLTAQGYTTARGPKIDNLDTAVSSRSSHTVADIWAAGTRTLTTFGTLVADMAAAVWGAATRTLTAFGFDTTLAASQPNYAPAKAGDAMTLTGDYDAAKTAAPTTDEVVLALLGRKITRDGLTGEFIIWDATGTTEALRLTPTSDPNAQPIIGMRPSE